MKLYWMFLGSIMIMGSCFSMEHLPVNMSPSLEKEVSTDALHVIKEVISDCSTSKFRSLSLQLSTNLIPPKTRFFSESIERYTDDILFILASAFVRSSDFVGSEDTDAKKYAYSIIINYLQSHPKKIEGSDAIIQKCDEKLKAIELKEKAKLIQSLGIDIGDE